MLFVGAYCIRPGRAQHAPTLTNLPIAPFRGKQNMDCQKAQYLIQEYLEKEWIKELHKKYKVEVDEAVLKGLIK